MLDRYLHLLDLLKGAGSAWSENVMEMLPSNAEDA
jgi:hypothetical protein